MEEPILDTDPTQELIYPDVADRVKAAMVDVVILIMLMYFCSVLFGVYETGENVKIFAFVVLFLLYDPLLTSTIGGTIGHMILGLRVRKKKDHSSKINLFAAIARFAIKSLLGWISLLTVSFNPMKRAIHDKVVGSVVVHNETMYRTVEHVPLDDEDHLIESD
ncbi:MAG: putative RDD family membrane protein YckC [Bacteroidia bacterium]|jgi:uncharacterized RDD family membrane protein YckC